MKVFVQYPGIETNFSHLIRTSNIPSKTTTLFPLAQKKSKLWDYKWKCIIFLIVEIRVVYTFAISRNPK